jgi:hypothetical protein
MLALISSSDSCSGLGQPGPITRAQGSKPIHMTPFEFISIIDASIGCITPYLNLFTLEKLISDKVVDV